jgi:hypothetical protein
MGRKKGAAPDERVLKRKYHKKKEPAKWDRLDDGAKPVPNMSQ